MVQQQMNALPPQAPQAPAVAGSPATPGNLSRARAFGLPRRSSSLNASIDGLDAVCSKRGPAAYASSPAVLRGPEPPRGCRLEALATASLALGMMSPPAYGGAAAQPATATSALAAGARGTERYRGEPVTLGQSRSQPMVALRSLPATEVTKHPGVKNVMKVRRLRRSRP